MDRNRITRVIARNVAAAIAAAGLPVPVVAQAADITTLQLTDRLTGRVEFQYDELVRVGGFLRLPDHRFLEEAA